MKLFAIFILVGAFLLPGPGCVIVDPLIIAIGLPLEVCADLNGGNSWDNLETYNIEDEINDISTEYLDNVLATRVNDIRVYMTDPPASGTSSGTLFYAFSDGTMRQLATWTDVPFSTLAAPGVSILDTSVVSYDPTELAALLGVLQDSTGLFINQITIRTVGSTSVNVPAGKTICARIDYQLDVEL